MTISLSQCQWRNRRIQGEAKAECGPLADQRDPGGSGGGIPGGRTGGWYDGDCGEGHGLREGYNQDNLQGKQDYKHDYVPLSRFVFHICYFRSMTKVER